MAFKKNVFPEEWELIHVNKLWFKRFLSFKTCGINQIQIIYKCAEHLDIWLLDSDL